MSSHALLLQDPYQPRHPAPPWTHHRTQSGGYLVSQPALRMHVMLAFANFMFAKHTVARMQPHRVHAMPTFISTTACPSGESSLSRYVGSSRAIRGNLGHGRCSSTGTQQHSRQHTRGTAGQPAGLLSKSIKSLFQVSGACQVKAGGVRSVPWRTLG